MEKEKIKIFLGLKPKKALNAKDAQNIYDYGKSSVSIEEAAQTWIKQRESSIVYASQAKRRAISVMLEEEEPDMIELCIKHFKDQGFFVKLETYPEIHGQRFLVIGW